jgi:hypothetical protein
MYVGAVMEDDGSIGLEEGMEVRGSFMERRKRKERMILWCSTQVIL